MKIALIYLAAGNSRRFGNNKLLYEWNGKPLYRHLLDRLIHLSTKCEDYEIFVITQYKEIQLEVEKLCREYDRISCICSPQSRKGVSFSVCAGLDAGKEKDACVFFVADQPGLTEESVEGFLDKMRETWHEEREKSLGCVSFYEKPGNPIWFGQGYYGELRKLSGDKGGRSVFNQYKERAVYYQVSEACELEDIDDTSGLPGGM